MEQEEEYFIISFNRQLEEWYYKNRRDSLPWRKTTDPYPIWVSEIMLQQTQVSRVAKDFFLQFMDAFPSIQKLSEATWEEVFHIWKGLGYYSRGKNMLFCAKIIQETFDGDIIKAITSDIEKLPGIGEYTRNAILSFALDEKVPAIDVNIKKIFSCLVRSFEGNIYETAEKFIKQSTSGRDWNSALMDLAQDIRTQKMIPEDLSLFFSATKVNTVFFPQISKKNNISLEAKTIAASHNIPLIRIHIACIRNGKKYIVQKEEMKEKQYTFPHTIVHCKENLRDVLKERIQNLLKIDISIRPHFYQKFIVTQENVSLLFFHRCQIQSEVPTLACPFEWNHIERVSIQKFPQEYYQALIELQKKYK